MRYGFVIDPQFELSRTRSGEARAETIVREQA